MDTSVFRHLALLIVFFLPNYGVFDVLPLPDPLPDLGPADLRRGRVLHSRVIDKGSAARQPGLDKAHTHTNIVRQARQRYAALQRGPRRKRGFRAGFRSLTARSRGI